MDAEEMARIYAAAFPKGRAWSAAELQALIDGPGGFVVTCEHGFAIGRSIAGEAELITIALDPKAQGRGAGRALLAAFEAGSDADVLFLEVAEDNAAARALYLSAGWRETGRRRGYYARASGAVDAVLMGKTRAGD